MKTGRSNRELVAFDLVHRGDDLTGWPYTRRRAALEALFAERGLTAPWVLCPSTTDPALAREWLSWTAAGVEGLCIKRLDEPYRGSVRSWQKYKNRMNCICHNTPPALKKQFTHVRRVRAMLVPVPDVCPEEIADVLSLRARAPSQRNDPRGTNLRHLLLQSPAPVRGVRDGRAHPGPGQRQSSGHLHAGRAFGDERRSAASAAASAAVTTSTAAKALSTARPAFPGQSTTAASADAPNQSRSTGLWDLSATPATNVPAPRRSTAAPANRHAYSWTGRPTATACAAHAAPLTDLPMYAHNATSPVTFSRAGSALDALSQPG
ncbi:hypothetical protein [Streptomyces sp. NPDC058678]|uniref:ATP-dependent DNA ligase n=1 Tax=Streptomyces sp. NPDC058678 TaxID=3346595 RepID=UPI00366074C0